MYLALTYAYLCSLASWLLMLVNALSFLSSSVAGLALLVILFASPVAAAPPLQSFPDLSFYDFAEFIQLHFPSDISLSTVLVLLFSLTENPEFLNLHGRQQHSKVGNEHCTPLSGWIKMFSRILLADRLRQTRDELFKPEDAVHLRDAENYTTYAVTRLSIKLNKMITLLGLNSHKLNGKLRHQRRAISYEAIEPIFLICPQAYQCETASCAAYSLVQNTQYAQVPQVTLLKGSDVHRSAFVLAGKCSRCDTSYYADHDRAWNEAEQRFDDCHLNSAVYLKLGQSTWADRAFTNSILNATYSFHASPSAFAEYWSNSFGNPALLELTRRHVWQGFVAESIRMVAQDYKHDLSTPTNLSIDDLCTSAFEALGSNGIIKAAEGHACDECSHPQKFGPDEAHLDPNDYDPVTMCVVDGIVMAPTVSILIFMTNSFFNMFQLSTVPLLAA